jgi:tRNA-dihydrouridine synthase
MGAALMTRSNRLREITTAMEKILGGSVPLTIKMRMGWEDKRPIAHLLVPQIQRWAAQPDQNIAAVMIHGRSRQQRCVFVLLAWC